MEPEMIALPPRKAATAGFQPPPAAAARAQAAAWSIDDEPMSCGGWHESSWMLRKGLEVIEDVPFQSLPLEWRLALLC
jgi:hypothetical protein